MRIAAVDLVSNTCFPALAAYELGYFKAQGLDVEIELVSSIGSTKALRAGETDAMIAGSVFDALTEFPDWEGAKVCVALSQGTPWLLTMRSDLAAERGDIQALRGLTLTAAEGPARKEFAGTLGGDFGIDASIANFFGRLITNLSNVWLGLYFFTDG